MTAATFVIHIACWRLFVKAIEKLEHVHASLRYSANASYALSEALYLSTPRSVEDKSCQSREDQQKTEQLARDEQRIRRIPFGNRLG